MGKSLYVFGYYYILSPLCSFFSQRFVLPVFFTRLAVDLPVIFAVTLK